MKKFAVALACILFAGIANATVVWNVSDAANTGCGSHGLWTDGTKSGCDRYYSFQSGTLTTEDAGTATLQATATRGASTAFIFLEFGAYTNDHTDIGTLKGTGNGDESTWDFYRGVSGTIELDGAFFVINGLAGATALQVGQGANDKSSNFGASAWITGPGIPDHWDLNMDLTAAAVPEPSSILLMGAGLGLLGLRRRKQTA